VFQSNIRPANKHIKELLETSSLLFFTCSHKHPLSFRELANSKFKSSTSAIWTLFLHSVMCYVYQTTSIVGQDRQVHDHAVECSKKPEGGTPQQCPAYSFIPAGSSRKKKELPKWATMRKGDKKDNITSSLLPPTPEE
jgi:hypothetical protein